MRTVTHFKLLIVITILITGNKLYAQQPVTWDYPIKPGSPEFKSSPTLSGSLALLNIPDNILKQMDTYHLVNTCLSYPQFGWVWTRNSLQEGYDFIKRNFNGFREMEIRQDAARYLLTDYQKMDPLGFNPAGSHSEIGGYIGQFVNIELMLAQYGIIHQCNATLKLYIIEEALKKFEQKSFVKNYGEIGLLTTAYILARYLQSERALVFDHSEDVTKISDFLAYCRYSDLEFLNVIANQARNYLSER
jgi:hypothetical protein